MRLANRRIWAGYDGTLKPPAGWEIDPDHPLSVGLRIAFCPDHANGQSDLLGNLFTSTVFSGSVAAVPGNAGVAIRYAAGSTIAYHANTTVSVPTTACTVLLVTNPVNASGSAFGNHDSTGDGATRLQVHLPFSGTVYWDFGGFSGSNRVSWTPAAGWFGAWHPIAFRAGTRGSSIWSDGVSQASQGTAITRTAETTPGFDIGRFIASGTNSNQGPVESLWLFGRELSDAEIVAWSAAPYAHLMPPAPRRTVVVLSGSTFNVTASGGIVLGGSAAPAITWSPTGSGGIVLGGTAAGTPTFAPSPSGGIILGGTVTATPTFAPVPSGGVVLGGTSAPSPTFAPVGSGGIVLAGAATPSPSYAPSPSGTITLGGTAPGSLGSTSGGTSARMGRASIWHGFTGEQKPPGGWEVAPRSTAADGLLAWLVAAEGAGNSLADLAGRAPATLQGGATWAAGPRGAVLAVSGSSQYALFPAISFTGAFTLSWWARHATPDSTLRMAIGDTTATNKVGINTTNTVFFVRVVGGGSSETLVPVPSANAWHHYALVRDVANVCTLWIDGTPNSLFSAAAQSGTSTWSNFGGSVSGGQWWNGQLDSLMAWGRALVLSELLDLRDRPFAALNPPASRAMAGGTLGPTFPQTPAGGVVLGGTVTATPTWSPTPAGGIVLGGTATATPTFAPSPAGGIVLGGTATRAFTLVASASGGIVLGGTVAPTAAFAATPTGTVVIGGAATASGAGQFNATASGGIVLGGTAPGILGFSRVAAGGLSLSGTALPPGLTFSPVPSGGIILGGHPVPGVSFAATASGGIVLGGVAIVRALGLGVGPSHFRSTVYAPLDPYRSTTYARLDPYRSTGEPH